MKKNKLFILALVALLSVGVLTACSTKEEPSIETETPVSSGENQVIDEYGFTINEDSITFIDGRDEEVTIKKNPERVVILFNSYLDIWMRNGGSIVGKLEESADQEPIPGTEGVQIIGALGSISAEKVLEVEPDLIILVSTQKSQMEMVPIFEENNIPFIALPYKVKEDYYKLTKLFSSLNGRDDLYEENAEKVRTGIEDIIKRVPEEKENRVLIMVANTTSVTARGSDSTVGEMLKDLNCVNIADSAGDMLNDKNFSIEKILEEDPDFIFVQTMGSNTEKAMERLKADVESNPAWASLSAVKNDRYIALSKDLYWFKPNHRYAEAYEGLAKILYPEVFK